MNLLNVQQGSKEWHATRMQHFTASEAPAMMGVSKYLSRDGLLNMKVTKEIPEVNPAQQVIFDKGHAAEAKGRAFAESIAGDELYPVTATDGAKLLASFDGLTMAQDIVFEHKLWNKDLAAAVRRKELAPHYYWQLEQQLLVSGASKAIFVVSDGTEENLDWMEYAPVPGRAAALTAGWDQFEKDMIGYQPIVEDAKPEAEVIKSLPTLAIKLVGEVQGSNLVIYKKQAEEYIDSINTNLTTDEDFINAESAAKFCEKAEKNLELVKQQAIAQTATIEELFSALDEIKDKLRAKRLTLGSLVKSRKQAIKLDIVQAAQNEISRVIIECNDSLAPVCIPHIPSDFYAVIKGKRTVKSIQEAVNDELARAKIAAHEATTHTRKSIDLIASMAPDHDFLFTDLQNIVTKAPDDLELLIKSRISEYEKKLEQEQMRRAQEQQQQEAAKELEAPLRVVGNPTAQEENNAESEKPSATNGERELQSRLEAVDGFISGGFTLEDSRLAVNLIYTGKIPYVTFN